ncbi:hypothetical protein [Roseibium alexandrii]|uniref:hypothetical protein n=1 Tax=Roseibium alexandrii TaxID=388408 RepID=UPI00375137E2
MTKPLSQYSSRELQQFAQVIGKVATLRKQTAATFDVLVKSKRLDMPHMITANNYHAEARLLEEAAQLLETLAAGKSKAAA